MGNKLPLPSKDIRRRRESNTTVLPRRLSWDHYENCKARQRREHPKSNSLSSFGFIPVAPASVPISSCTGLNLHEVEAAVRGLCYRKLIEPHCGPRGRVLSTRPTYSVTELGESILDEKQYRTPSGWLEWARRYKLVPIEYQEEFFQGVLEQYDEILALNKVEDGQILINRNVFILLHDICAGTVETGWSAR